MYELVSREVPFDRVPLYKAIRSIVREHQVRQNWDKYEIMLPYLTFLLVVIPCSLLVYVHV